MWRARVRSKSCSEESAQLVRTRPTARFECRLFLSLTQRVHAQRLAGMDELARLQRLQARRQEELRTARRKLHGQRAETLRTDTGGGAAAAQRQADEVAVAEQAQKAGPGAGSMEDGAAVGSLPEAVEAKVGGGHPGDGHALLAVLL